MDTALSVLISAGFLMFGAGVLSRSYMIVKVQGFRAFYTFQSGRTPRNEYTNLVQEGQAPAWVLFMSRKGLLIGVAMCDAANGIS